MQNMTIARVALILAAGLFITFSGSAMACEASDAGCRVPITAKPDEAEAPVAAGKAKQIAPKRVMRAVIQVKPRQAGKNQTLRIRVAGSRSVKTARRSAKNAARVAQRMPVNKTITDKDFWVADARAEYVPEPTAKDIIRTIPAAVAAVDVAEARPVEENAAIVAADQLNELDRAALIERDVAPRLANASVVVPEVMSRDSSKWDQTSAIGKIFIAFGGLLTLASAARFFVA